MNGDELDAAGIPVTISARRWAARIPLIIVSLGLAGYYLMGLGLGVLLEPVPFAHRATALGVFVGAPTFLFLAVMKLKLERGATTDLFFFMALASFLSLKATSIYNCSADDSAPEVFEAKVVGVAPMASGSDSSESWFTVESWRTPGDTITLDLGTSTHASVAINSRVRVSVRSGKLGADWVSGFEVIPPADPLKRRLDEALKALASEAATPVIPVPDGTAIP